MTDINEILAKLNPKVAESFKLARDTRNDLQALPSINMTRTLGGGIGYGRQTLVWGNRSGGKTASLLQTVALAQKEGKGAAWIDAEKNFDKTWAARLGVDTDQLIVSRVASIADMTDAGVDLLRAGVDIMIVDSISALLPNSYLVEGEVKEFSGTGQIGTFSKNMGSACMMLNKVNDHTALVFVSQVRNEFGSMHASLKPMGGKGLDHMNSTSIKLWSSMAEAQQITGEVTDGDTLYTKPIGRQVTWTIDKNRGPGMGMSGTYDFYFDGPEIGIDRVGETFDLAVFLGKISKGGAWYTIYGERFQGRPKALAYVKENPEIFEKLEADVFE